MTTDKNLHFTLAGDNFTRMVRNLHLEGQPSRAWRVITKGLGGGEESLDAVARDVLDGKARFEGDESLGFDVIEEVNEDYQKSLKFAYAGRTRLPRETGWWRPRAEVVGLKAPVDPKTVEKYAFEGERFFKVSGRFILWEPCEELPHWWEVPSPEAALGEFTKLGHYLEETYEGEWGSPEPSTGYSSGATLDLAREEFYEDPAKMEALHNATLKTLRKTINDQAGTDYLAVEDIHGVVVGKAPKAALVNYALGGTTLSHLSPPWRMVSPQGLKTGSDNPYHTDAYLGALDLEGNPFPWSYTEGFPYESEFQSALFHTKGLIQKKFGKFECTVLSEGPHRVTGVVGVDILVLPDLNPDRLESILKAKALVTQEGGRGAHLVLVSLERNVPVVRVPQALERFRPGMVVTVDTEKGVITIPGVSSYWG